MIDILHSQLSMCCFKPLYEYHSAKDPIVVHSLKKPGQCGYSHATLNYFLSLLGNPSGLLRIPHNELCYWEKAGWGGVGWGCFVQNSIRFSTGY